jgi:hypothetical protein
MAVFFVKNIRPTAWFQKNLARMILLPKSANRVVYNNFPWPSPTAEQRERVEEKARAVLAAREQFMDWGAHAPSRAVSSAPAENIERTRTSHASKSATGASLTAPGAGALPKTATLANLYDPLSMPPALARAHADLDRAVKKCYRPEPFDSDRQRVEFLFALYEKLTAPLLPVTPKTRGRRSQTAAPTPRPRKQRTPALPGQKQNQRG